MICRVRAELGSLWSGPILCCAVPQWVLQSWVDAVLSSSLLSGPPLLCPVPKWLVYLVIAGFVLSCSGEFGSLWSGPTLCGPARSGSSSLLSGLILCVAVPQWVVQSWVDAVWSSSLWSGPTLWGPVLQ